MKKKTAIDSQARFAGQMPDVQIGMDVAPAPYVSIGALIASGDLSTGAMTTLAAAVNAIPYEPSYLGDRKVYTYAPAITPSVQIEFDGQSINLVQTTPSGTPGQETTLNPRSVKGIQSSRIARKVTVLAQEVAAIRQLMAAGLDTVETRADELIRNAVRDIRSTIEYHRVGGALGLLLDADGQTVIQNYFSLMGISQTTIDVTFSTPAAGKFLAIAINILNTLEDALGNLAEMGDDSMPIVICGRVFWSKFINSADVITAYQYFQAARQSLVPTRDDVRYADFVHGGVIWRQYRGQASNSSRFIPDNEAHVIVAGVPGTYLGYFCPPTDIMDQTNKPGIPLYVQMETLPFGRGLQLELQSNVVHVNARPATAIKLFSSN